MIKPTSEKITVTTVATMNLRSLATYSLLGKELTRTNTPIKTNVKINKLRFIGFSVIIFCNSGTAQPNPSNFLVNLMLGAYLSFISIPCTIAPCIIGKVIPSIGTMASPMTTAARI